MTIVKSALDAFAANTKKKFSDDRMSTVGASEIGKCARQTFWIKNEGTDLGVERDPDYIDNYGARMRGTVMEDRFWYPAMRAKFGKRLLYAGPYQKTFANNFLSATPDGLITKLTPEERDEIGIVWEPDNVGGNCVLAESKTLDPRANLLEPREANKYQTIVQMGLVRDCTPWRPSYTIISYTDASFWSEVKEFIVPFDQDIYNAALIRAQTIITETDVTKIAPEGWISGGDECRHCPFLKPCGIERRSLPFADDDKPVDLQFKAEITDMARAIKQAESDRDVSDVQMRALQDELKNRLREKGVRKVPGVVTWSAVKPRSGYDNKGIQAAALAAGVDLKPFETTGEPGDRLTIMIGAEAS